MSEDLFEIGSGPAFERMQDLSQRVKKLPVETREFVDELLEEFTVSVEELQETAEELDHQNAELLAARDEIEAQRNRYQDLFEFAPEGYLVTDPLGLILEANRAAKELLGVTQKYIIGKPLVIFLAPGERDSFYLRLARLDENRAASSDQREWEMRISPRQGEEFPAALTFAPIRDLKGELTGLRWLLRDITASKRAKEREQLLSESREQHHAAQEANRLLHALIETMPVGAVIVETEGTIVLTNTTGRQILGGSVGGTLEIPNRTYTSHRPDGSPYPLEKMPLIRAMKEKQPVKDVELLIRRADGEQRSILASAAPILDDDEKVISGITVFQDITERKQSRQALRQYAERLDVLRRADQVILAAGSLDELVESVLPFTRELVPCRLAAVLGFDREMHEAVVLGLLAADDAGLGEKDKRFPLDESWPLDELARGEMTIFEIDSLTTPVDAFKTAGVQFVGAMPLLAQDELLGVLFLGCEEQISLEDSQQDVIDQMADELAIGIRQIRQREQLQVYATQLERKVTRRTGALRESEERFRIILEAAVFGIALLDTKGRIVQSNRALQTMTGYSRDELQGMTFSEYYHPEDNDAAQNLYQELVSGETGHYQVEKRFVRKDGQVRWSELTVSRVRQTGRGKPWLAVAVMEDITEKKHIQETLARTERLTLAGRLGASLAHEINNPVQAVIGCLGLAEEMLEENDEARLYLDIAMGELERTAEIVTQLRDLGRKPEPGFKKTTDMNAFVEKILLLTRKRCQNQGVEVDWQPADDLPPLRISPEHMQQVFLNLVLNALNAMESKEGSRKMIVSTAHTSSPEGVSVTIRDTGVGIKAEMLEQIFEPFHSTRSDGLGLGLYISKNIVEEHGGRIEVESIPGDGATFTVWLPVV